MLQRRVTRFQAKALALLRARHLDIGVVRTTPEGAVLTLAGVEIRLDLASLYRRWGGEAGTEKIDRLADQIRGALPPAQTPAFTRVRPHLLPLIKPDAFAAVYLRYPSSLRLVARPFTEGLAIVYVVAGFHQITYVTEGMRESWNLPADELHHLALANLRRRTAHLLDELGGARSVYLHLDGFEAARILLPDLITPPELAPGIAAIPHEHLLMVAAHEDAPRLAEEAAAAFAAAKFPLSPAIFVLGEASLVPLVLS